MVTFVPSYVNCTDPREATLEQVAGILILYRSTMNFCSLYISPFRAFLTGCNFILEACLQSKLSYTAAGSTVYRPRPLLRKVYNYLIIHDMIMHFQHLLSHSFPDHIDHIRQTIGVDHIGIGSDFGGTWQ